MVLEEMGLKKIAAKLLSSYKAQIFFGEGRVLGKNIGKNDNKTGFIAKKVRGGEKNFGYSVGTKFKII